MKIRIPKILLGFSLTALLACTSALANPPYTLRVVNHSSTYADIHVVPEPGYYSRHYTVNAKSSRTFYNMDGDVFSTVNGFDYGSCCGREVVVEIYDH